MNGDNLTYFDSFKLNIFYGLKSDRKQKYHINIYRIQTNESLMLRYFWIY